MLVRVSLITCLLLALTACENQEPEARTILNQAILSWDAGDFVAGAELFDDVVRDYPTTQSAQDAAEELESRKEVYKSQRSQSANAQRSEVASAQRNKGKLRWSRNTGKVGRSLIGEIELHRLKTGAVPETIALLPLRRFNRKYANLCDYSKGIWGEGYWLDCTNAEITFHRELLSRQWPIESMLDDRRESRLTSELSQTRPTKPFKELKRANKTWGAALNPTNAKPEEKYFAAYINTKSPLSVIHSEIVEDIQINHASFDFHGIKPEDFGAYWVSTLTLDRPERRTISVDQEHSKTRVTIDSYIVFEGRLTRSVVFDLDAGKHVIEVEYVSNSQTSNFALRFSKA